MVRAVLVLALLSCVHRGNYGPMVSDPLPSALHPVAAQSDRGCLTKCGVWARGVTGPDCTALDVEESFALHAYSLHAKLDEAAMCSALEGWTIDLATVRQSMVVWWYFPVGWVHGVTDCGSKNITLGQKNWAAGALAHELGHVWRCSLYNPPEWGHGKWRVLGYCDSINAATTLKDDCSDPMFQ